MSLLAQLLSTIYSFFGLNVPLFNEDAILKDVLGLETVVQLIELAFYILFGFVFTNLTATTDIAIYRYADWFFTTPAMLLSTVVFMDYIRRKELPSDDPNRKELSSLYTFLENNIQPFLTIIIANCLMLLMGYLYEAGIIDIWTSTILGFVAFAVTFYTLQKKYAHNHQINQYLWYYMTSTWGMYGIAALFPNIIKNTMYNLLDIVSKNFYSVFLTTYILYL